MEKNVKAIDKIIGKLSLKDYLLVWDKLTEKQKNNVRIGKKKISYTLSLETLEAIDIKREYIKDNITEEEYKSYCLRYNLR